MTPQANIQALLERAQTLLALGRPRDAVTALLQALSLAPGHARALALLSLAHGNAGDHQEALRWADQAVAAAPDSEWGHRLRAIHLLSLNAPRDALRAAEEAVRLQPQTLEALQTLARTQLRQNRLRDAEATAARLHALAPDSYLAHEILGLLAIRRQAWRVAETHCRCALALRPDSYYALNNLGIALSRRASPYRPSADGRFAEAIDFLYRAVQVSPTEALARQNLTQTLSRYLMSEALFLLTVFILALPGHVGLADTFLCLLGFVPVAGVLLVVRRRRFRALPGAIQGYWRQTRRQWWKASTVGRLWGRKVR